MTTFSQLVDDMYAELVRPDLRSYIVSAVNQTIREVHTGKGGITHRFESNRVELDIVVPNGNDTNYNWEIPNFNRFQHEEAIAYPNGRYAAKKKPGMVALGSRAPIEDLWYYYQSGAYLCFMNYGLSGQTVKFSGFYYPRSLVYHFDPVTQTQPVGNRPADPRWASYDKESEVWTYRSGTGKTEEQLRDLSTNWLLMRWEELIKEGVRAKCYKRIGDTVRQSTAYSQFESMKLEMQAQEIGGGAGAFYGT